MLPAVLTKKRNIGKTKRKSPASSSRPGQSPLGRPRPKTQKRSTSNSSNAWTKRTNRIKRKYAKQTSIESLSMKERKKKREALLRKEQRKKNAITNWKKRQQKLARSSDEESSEEN